MSDVKTYEVGGVRMARPFKIRRFGHFGFNVDHLDEAVTFYTDELGFRITDDMNLFDLLDGPALEYARTVVTNPRMLFTSNSSDHHAVLLAHKTFGTLFGNDAVAKDNTVSQITWQVGTLDEVLDGAEYLRANNVRTVRLGRDMPGGNWHVYFLDPDGNTLELYYGMEQIGWDRTSKPRAMHYRGFDTAPPRPQMSEAAEIREALGPRHRHPLRLAALGITPGRELRRRRDPAAPTLQGRRARAVLLVHRQSRRHGRLLHQQSWASRSPRRPRTTVAASCTCGTAPSITRWCWRTRRYAPTSV